MRWILPLLALPLIAQEMRVYSEFRRLDANGAVAAPDRGGEPREILSPAVPRNAMTSFRLSIEMPAGADIWLEIGQNPENAVEVTAFEENGGRLIAVKLPYHAKLAPAATVATLWLDIRVPKNAPVDRIKFEPQLYFGDRWYTYPMEMRIAEAIAPPVKFSPAEEPAAGVPADASARAALQAALCGTPAVPAPGAPFSIWQATRRNALQDIALAGSDLGPLLLRVTKASSLKDWCAAPPRLPQGPEWYLRLRDEILKLRGNIP